MSEHLDKHEVEQAAYGRWAEIYSALVPGNTDWDLIDTSKKRTECPVHGSSEAHPQNLRAGSTEKWDSYGLVICNSCGSMNYVDVLKQALGWDFPTILKEVWSVVGTGAIARARPTIQRPERPKVKVKEIDVSNTQATARALMAAAVPLDHPSAAPVINYLASRKIGPVYGPLADILCVPEARYPFDLHGTYPVMLSVVRRATGERINLHQTWLKPDGSGKADVRTKKTLLPRMESGPWAPTIQLDPAGEILCLCEGVETALAVRAMIDLPVWSVVSAGSFDELELPECVKVVLVFADYDPEYVDEKGREVGGVGLKHAQAFASRVTAPTRVCRVMLPTPPVASEGFDWEDYLKHVGHKEGAAYFQTFRKQAQRDLDMVNKIRAQIEAQLATLQTQKDGASREVAATPEEPASAESEGPTPVDLGQGLVDDRYPFDVEEVAA